MSTANDCPAGSYCLKVTPSLLLVGGQNRNNCKKLLIFYMYYLGPNGTYSEFIGNKDEDDCT